MCLIEVDVDSLKLEVAVSLIDASCIEPMFITDHFPKLETNEIKENIIIILTDLMLFTEECMLVVAKLFKRIPQNINAQTIFSSNKYTSVFYTLHLGLYMVAFSHGTSVGIFFMELSRNVIVLSLQ